ncbi:uracil-DNA glycosylase [archaeon]|nr:uracil-DNA glycosylase [archaeon]
MQNQEALEQLKQKTSEANLPLKESATNIVFGKGNPEAKIFFIGEAPGNNEDLQGLPFVGAAGKQLDQLLHMINLCIEDVYIANVLKYRPPENRNPNDEEIKTHTPFLIEQIKIIKPKVIVTLGNFSTKFILGNFSVEGMKKMAGITHLHGVPVEKELDGLKFLVFPMYHPAATLY